VTAQVTVESYRGAGDEWDAFVHSQPSATNYHLFAWRAVVERSFGHQTHYLAARDAAGAIVGILPLVHMQSRLFGNFLVSLPFFNYGGLLLSLPQAANCLLDEAGRLMSQTGATHVELRHLGWQQAGAPARTGKVTMLLKLSPDVESQWKAFNAKLRNQVRKAEKGGLQTVVGGIELLDGFYQVFCRNMRDLGTPVYGKEFFANVLGEFPQATRIISVTHQDRVIASGIACWHKDTLEIPWASSNRDFKALCPNNILYWKAISFAIESGFSTFDFGRSTPNEGTFKFKEQWGARPEQLYWQYLLREGESLPELNTKNPKYQMAIALWQKLPVALTRIIGPGIVRSIP
jgi:FemAB-related protein (PEP-CTERM system-associated)